MRALTDLPVRGKYSRRVEPLPVFSRVKAGAVLELTGAGDHRNDRAREADMRYAVFIVLLLAAAGCAKNRESEESGAGAAQVADTTRLHDSTRIHDTTLTAKDTTNPNDTLPHIRDCMPDSTR